MQIYKTLLDFYMFYVKILLDFYKFYVKRLLDFHKLPEATRILYKI